MKKRVVSLLLACTLMLVLGLSAGAASAGKEGFTGIAVADAFSNTVFVEPLKADGTAAELVGDVYVDAVKLRVTYTDAAPSCYYMVMALATDNGIPTDNSILYIDQTTAGNEAEFVVYPKAMDCGETGYIYLSSNADSGIGNLTQVASFTYVSYRPGDVDGNGSISSNDALLVMNAIGELKELDVAQQAAADVDGNGIVTVEDALYILQAVVHLRTLN